MKILAVDTTTQFLCLGFYGEDKLYEYNLELGRRHSELLVPTISRALRALDWQLEDIDYFACGLGPGSFTGVRIGLAAIKGFAFALNKPVVGISTLDIIARNAKESDAAYIMPIIDARRNLLYCSLYKKEKGGLRRIRPYLLLSEKEFLREAKPKSIILGDAAALYKEKILKNIKGAAISSRDYWYPQARHLIALALERIKKEKFDNPFKVKPIYLYPKECQIKQA